MYDQRTQFARARLSDERRFDVDMETVVRGRVGLVYRIGTW